VAKHGLLDEALRFGQLTRRGFVSGAATIAAGAGALASGLVTSASAQEFDVPKTGKKVRVGLGLNYGPFNQPWRRGCWQLGKTVVVPVTQWFLALKRSPDVSKSQNSLLNSQIGGKSHGDGCDQHCIASQAFRVSKNLLL
jgi:hypothetical protein